MKVKIKRTAGFIDLYTNQIFIWKCCGDALAFIYLDKFAIKHAFYDVDAMAVKRGAGMLRDKEGLLGELEFLSLAIENGVPAVLCDITNTLRYGDVCLLGASDPTPIEVKSSPRQSARGKRQLEKMGKLRDFLEQDGAVGFRGTPGETKRKNLTVPERNNRDALNDCLAEAKRESIAVSRPEPGIYYIVVNGKKPDFPLILGDKVNERHAVYMLNGDKNDFAWAPYTPFILSICDPQLLLDFIEGVLFIIVVVSMDELSRQMAAPGWEVYYSPDSDYALQAVHAESQAVVGIAQQLVARTAYEFSSLGWLAESQKLNIDELREMQSSVYGPYRPVEMEEMQRRMFGKSQWLRADVEALFLQEPPAN